MAPPSHRCGAALLVLLAACSPGPDTPPPGGGETSDDSGVVPDTDDSGGETGGDTQADDTAEEEPDTSPPILDRELSRDEVQQRWATSFFHGLPDPRVTRDLYVSMMQSGDADCPAEMEIRSYNVGPKGCTADTGYYYLGLSHFYDGQAYLDANPGSEALSTASFSLQGDFTIRDPEGEPYMAGGNSIYRLDEPVDGQHRYVIQFTGTWIYAPAGGWLEDTTSLNLQFSGSAFEDRLTSRINGGITLHGGTYLFDELIIGGTDCADKATGSVKIRDTSGAWFTLTFPETCDPCGDLVFDDREDLGKACPSFDGIHHATINNLADLEEATP